MASSTMAGVTLFVSLILAPEPPKNSVEAVTLKGTVVELTAALKPTGLAFDSEPIAKQVVVRDREGAITPLLSDEASRALFLDERLRGRPVEIQARRHPGLPYLQVVSFKVEEEGRLRTPEYYCEICTISVRYPQICPCCQGPMELRMKPESR
jgi:hypothetical protein